LAKTHTDPIDHPQFCIDDNQLCGGWDIRKMGCCRRGLLEPAFLQKKRKTSHIQGAKNGYSALLALDIHEDLEKNYHLN
jgi:hypothetical protein